MSREGGAAGACRRDGGSSGSVAPQSFPPQFYPVVGYQGNSHTWFVPHPSSGVPSQWSPSWHPPMGYPAPTPPWSGQQTPSTTSTATTVAPASDEYTVDTLRRIYKDDDGRVEIQRVKVQRRPPDSGAVSLAGPEAMSVVPVGAISRNERRPPPRKHRRKPDIPMTAMGPMGPYPWYPYMPYMPYPYPYPYYFGNCMWPSGAPSGSISTWSGNEDSEAVSSHQDSALNSQRLESRVSHLSGDSLPSALHRASSPTAASHITESHSIAPSDSVSVRGRKRETSLERALLGPTPPPRTKSRASSSLDCKSDHVGKTQEWMLEMQRALRTGSDVAVKADNNSALRSDQNEVYRKIPPVRKRRRNKAADMSDQSSMSGLKEVDDVSEQQSVISEATFDDSSRLSPELTYAFRKLERSVDAFRTEIATESSPVHSFAPSPSVDISHSSGAATPTEANVTPLPFSDICGLAKEEEIMKREKYGRPRTTSESVCSLPSLEMARVGSAPDVSLRSKATVVSSSQFNTSTETRATTLTPTNTCPSPGAQTSTTSTSHVITTSTETGSVKPQELTSKTEESKVVPVQLSTSDTNASPLPKSPPPPACQPSSPPHSHQAEDTKEQSHKTTEATETGIPKETAEVESPPALESIGPPSFKSTDVSATDTPAATGSEGVGGASGRLSQASSATTFFSVRTADDSHTLDTDSTDIPMPTTDSADENEESPGSAGPEEDQVWVLQRPNEAPTLNTTGQDEHRNAWRAEVSLWRASLVVSLCRGRGLDRQDWTTFHLMVHHPLTMDLKLSLLHAPRLCAANSSVGPAVLRVALIQLAQYGELLLQPEASRQPGWRCIKLDAGQAWASLKGAAEILHSLGYQERRNGLELKYRQRCSPEASVVARLTLDMLVLAEEFRLFLTGTHQYPTNVSSLFFPESLNTGAISDLPLRPPSSEGSFVSAQSEAVIAARPQSEASSVTDDDTETLQTCTIQTAQSKLTRNKSTSEEDVTLREEDNKIVAVEKDTASAKKEEHKTEVAVEKDTASAEKEEHETETTAQPSTEANTKASPERQVPPTPIIPDEAAAPDTQAKLATTRTSEASPGNETVTPTTTPAEPSAVDSSCKTDKDSLVSTPAATNDTTNDNPEEHVYEEIDVIRAQVQSLRASSVPAESVPPPLPPKKKINAGGEDESQLSFTYPHVDRSSASTPASLRGGSTGARRKKRRAPMPPEFLPPNWKESQETPKQQDLEVKDKKQESAEPSTTKKAEYRRSLNPFYEELECVENSVKEADDNKDADQEDALDSNEDKGNPFLEKKVKVKGYIGKNPFYEDVEILKKSDEYKELEASQPSPAALESTPAPVITSEHHEPPLRKRRAPHPPPSTQAQDTSATSHPEDSAHPQHGIDNLEAANAPQATERSDGSDQPCKQISQSSPDESNIDSSLLASSDSTKTDPENKTDPEPETKDPINKDAKIVAAENKSTPPPLPEDGPQERQMEAAVPTTPKQSRVTRTPLPHPKVPPPPLPPLPKIPTSSLSTEESPPPIPPPKAPLSLFDEIPYMDANEIKEAQEQTQSSDSHLQSIAGGGSPAAVVKFSHTLSRQSPLARADDVNLPPLGLPPPPPCPPPESPPETPHTSPPETPHTSPPETPHVSPPETPHTSPPETPHASPPVTPRPSPKHTPLPPSRHKPSLTTEKEQQHEKADAVTRAEDEAPPVPPKPFQLEIANGEAPSLPPRSPIIPPKAIQQGDTQHPPRSPKASHTSHTPVTGTVSSTSEERYEIPDTSRAPPPRPPIQIPIKTQQQQQQHQEQQQQQQQKQQEQVNGKTSTQSIEDERYEVPEVPKHPIAVVSKGSVEVVKAPETEERYEIPEVVKDQPVKRGVNGAVCTAGLGPTSSARKGEIAAIFGPPKPPRRRRHNHSPPPRPPKSCSLDGTKTEGLNEVSLGSTSTTSSYTSSSSGHPPPSLQHKSNTKHRSWPFLLCNCLYVNCRTYEDADK